VPGTYLIKLTTAKGGAHYVPLTIRDDSSTAALLAIDAVTTWQAYNDWGACSLYSCRSYHKRNRADVVSFDRPYAHTYNRGSADFLDHELSLIAFVEQLGFDVTYLTSVDLDQDPFLALDHRAVLSLGHDEYFSTAMREALVSARDAGVNLAFFGANAVYRHIRLEMGRTGVPARREVNYRSTNDPGAKADPMRATVEWRRPPLNQPESLLVGLSYECANVSGDVRIVDPSSWVFAGTGLRRGQLLPKLVGAEADRAHLDRFTPPNLEVLAHSSVQCNGGQTMSDMAYYSAWSGAGVFATGTIFWICSLDGTCPQTARVAPAVRAITLNVLEAFAAGPAGVDHPSHGNLKAVLAGSSGSASAGSSG